MNADEIFLIENPVFKIRTKSSGTHYLSHVFCCFDQNITGSITINDNVYQLSLTPEWNFLEKQVKVSLTDRNLSGQISFEDETKTPVSIPIFLVFYLESNTQSYNYPDNYNEEVQNRRRLSVYGYLALRRATKNCPNNMEYCSFLSVQRQDKKFEKLFTAEERDGFIQKYCYENKKSPDCLCMNFENSDSSKHKFCVENGPCGQTDQLHLTQSPVKCSQKLTCRVENNKVVCEINMETEQNTNAPQPATSIPLPSPPPNNTVPPQTPATTTAPTTPATTISKPEKGGGFKFNEITILYVLIGFVLLFIFAKHM